MWDYRKLFEALRIASYSLPNITEKLDRPADAKFFTTIDMVSGYHQIEVDPDDQHKTFRLIEDMLQVLDAEDVMAYLDDVICFHSGFEEHFKGIGRLLQTIKKAGFKLSGKKCQFATRSVKFLGHVHNQRSWT